MTKNLDNKGLQSIADNYDLFYIDLWGVIPDGVQLHEKAVRVLKEFLKINKIRAWTISLSPFLFVK